MSARDFSIARPMQVKCKPTTDTPAESVIRIRRELRELRERIRQMTAGKRQ